MANIIRSVFFDLDGTIVDTEPVAADAVIRSFKSWGIQLDIRDASSTTGVTWQTSLDWIFKRFPPPVSQEEAKDHIFKTYHDALLQNIPEVRGSVASVRALAAHFPLGLVSGSRREDILMVLTKLGILDCFKVILGAENYPRSKPAPDGYLQGFETLGVKAEECLIFEDSTAGITAARAAGAWVVAVTSTNHFQQDASAAHACIEDFADITPAWVASWDARLQKLSIPIK